MPNTKNMACARDCRICWFGWLVGRSVALFYSGYNLYAFLERMVALLSRLPYSMSTNICQHLCFSVPCSCASSRMTAVLLIFGIVRAEGGGLLRGDSNCVYYLIPV